MNQQTTNRDTGEAAATNAPANSATSTSTPDNQPTPLDAFEVLLITGMSGAGRSHAADCVEDMGWYVVDNLPPKLLIPLVDMMTTSGSGSESGVHKLAAVIDVRSSYFDELAAVLGKETIDTYNTGESRGRETSHSLNYQKLGKELMSQDELAVMDGGKCILQLRGVRPFLSDKYDITKHPNFKYTADADDKNAFDIEAFLSARLKLKPNEVCDVYEVDTEGA